MLHDAGYDVWMVNTRGNTWSKNHVSLISCKNCSEFWDFQWEKTAVKDYPAEIDYILDYTGYDDLFIVGYSMGTTQYFAMLSDLPEYNKKIKAGFMMAPISYGAVEKNIEAYNRWNEREETINQRSIN